MNAGLEPEAKPIQVGENNIRTCLLLFILSLLTPTLSMSDETGFSSLSISAGRSTHTERFDFNSLDLSISYVLPWKFTFYYDLVFKTSVNGSVGVMEQDEDYELITTIGPGVSLGIVGYRLLIDGGGGIVFLSDDEVGGHEFGGIFQFYAHGGVSYRIFESFAIGYRFLHVSDAGISSGHGVNRHLVELTYYFQLPFNPVWK